MPIFAHKPFKVEAVQFTGNNWAEMQMFTGTREIKPNRWVHVFNPIGIYMPAHLYRTGSAELWVAPISTHLILEVGDWVVRDDRGCYPWKKAVFETMYDLIDESKKPIPIVIINSGLEVLKNAFGSFLRL